jgi:hypothetical protein
MEKRIRSVSRPSSSSATSGAPAVDNFLQVLPPERSLSAAPVIQHVLRAAPAVRVGSLVKPSRGVIATEAVKRAANSGSDSCLKLEQLVLDAAEFQSAQNSGRSIAACSSRRCVAHCVRLSHAQPTPLASTSAPPSGFFFTGVPGLEESCSITTSSPILDARSSSAAAAIPRSQSQPLSPSSPDSILQVTRCPPFLVIS